MILPTSRILVACFKGRVCRCCDFCSRKEQVRRSISADLFRTRGIGRKRVRVSLADWASCRHFVSSRDPEVRRRFVRISKGFYLTSTLLEGETHANNEQTGADTVRTVSSQRGYVRAAKKSVVCLK